MADLEDGVEMLDRHRDRIGRIGNLADEAAVLAHRMREPDAHAGRSAVQHLLEDALVLRDRADVRRFSDSVTSATAASAAQRRRWSP